MVLAVDDGNALLSAALVCTGILPIPHHMADGHVASGELEPLFEGWPCDSMPVYLAHPPNRHVSARLRVSIDRVVERMAIHAPMASQRKTIRRS
ncbi:MAG: LysR substrate-binding domain-containing protein [Hydrogenophaga sp.]|nr:LysR substrate-binding domain-containing protein [Hydrogenophaga sp.]MDO8906494.1 LysR substrate-binding domain-containing protein [Hydrogenophaga sp.]